MISKNSGFIAEEEVIKTFECLRNSVSFFLIRCPRDFRSGELSLFALGSAIGPSTESMASMVGNGTTLES